MRKFCFCITLLFLSKTLFTQDNNYWMQMPGSRSALMGGAVVGGVRDNSSIFYNPGALGFVDTNTISVSASTYQYEIGHVYNGSGIGINLSSQKFETFPLVSLSGIINPKKNPNTGWAL